MLVIKDTLVSLDLIEKYFCCDLEKCKGECCIEGDAGAPVTPEEVKAIEEILPQIFDELLPGAQEVVKEQGIAYTDSDGDLVTSIVNGRDCVFTTYAPGGICLCLLEKTYREGRLPQTKPASCHLYPCRLAQCGQMTALNFHHWKICHSAVKNGARHGIRAYEFLREPLTRCFGPDWYKELALAASEYLSTHNS